MARAPRGLESRNTTHLEVTCRQFQDPRPYLARIEHIYASSPPESYDLLRSPTEGCSSGFRRFS